MAAIAEEVEVEAIQEVEFPGLKWLGTPTSTKPNSAISHNPNISMNKQCEEVFSHFHMRRKWVPDRHTEGEWIVRSFLKPALRTPGKRDHLVRSPYAVTTRSLPDPIPEDATEQRSNVTVLSHHLISQNTSTRRTWLYLNWDGNICCGRMLCWFCDNGFVCYRSISRARTL